VFGDLWWLFLLLLLVLSLVTRQGALILLTVLLALGAVLSWLSYRLGLYGVRYTRSLRDRRIFCNQETELAIEVTNAKPLPLAWLLVRDRFLRGLGLVVQDRSHGEDLETSPPELRELIVLRGHESARRTYRVRGYRRGVYTFGTATMTSGALFGLQQKRETFERLDHLTVYPKIVPVESLELPFERPAGTGRARRRITEDPLRQAGVREYVPGDSVRHIHWKNTAHLGILQTKLFDPQASEVVMLALDVQTTYDPYQAVPEYLELLISSTASLAVDMLEQRQSTGLLVNSGPGDTEHWTRIAPSRHPEQGARLLEALAPLTGFRTLALSHLLYRSMHVLPYGSTVVVLTARTVEPVLLALLALQRAGHSVVLLTVGDRQPWIPERFTTHHLGGRDAWHRLEGLALA